MTNARLKLCLLFSGLLTVILNIVVAKKLLSPEQYWFAAKINPFFIFMLVSAASFVVFLFVFLKRKSLMRYFAALIVIASFPYAIFFLPHRLAARGIWFKQGISIQQPVIRADKKNKKMASVREDLNLKELLGVAATCTLILPEDFRVSGKNYPLILVIGHPWENAESRIADFTDRQLSLEEDCIIARSGVIDEISQLPGNKTISVQSPMMWQKYSPLFPLLLQHLKNEYPVDEDMICFTGYSFDGVWSLMLGLAFPQICKGVVGMSAVTYPPQIQNNIAVASAVPIIILRGERDHMFPYRFKQEVETARQICALNPDSDWVLVPGARHGNISAFWTFHLNRMIKIMKHRKEENLPDHRD